MSQKYTDIIVTVQDGIGTIKFNRPKALNSFGGSMIQDTIAALRELDADPKTVVTVITGEGRFFAAGADISSVTDTPDTFKNDGEKKLFWVQQFAVGQELVRSMIDHSKVLVLSMNGPGVGAGAAWFQGVADLFYMADDAWIQITFSELGLVPENGSAAAFAQSVGVHRANEWLMFGGKASAKELLDIGMVNKIFPKQGFHDKVQNYLADMLKERDGKAMMEMKRLQNARTRDARLLALFESSNALAELFVDGEPLRRMKAKGEELAAKRRNRPSKI